MTGWQNLSLSSLLPGTSASSRATARVTPPIISRCFGAVSLPTPNQGTDQQLLPTKSLAPSTATRLGPLTNDRWLTSSKDAALELTVSRKLSQQLSTRTSRLSGPTTSIDPLQLHTLAASTCEDFYEDLKGCSTEQKGNAKTLHLNFWPRSPRLLQTAWTRMKSTSLRLTPSHQSEWIAAVSS